MISHRLLKSILILILLAHDSPLVFSAEVECSAGGECETPDVQENLPDDEQAEVKPAAESEPEDPNCPSRPHVIRCAEEYLDSNNNRKLERSELEDAINSLPWYAKGVLKILGSVKSIMRKCDADGDDAISIDEDMDATKDRCLATCFKRKAFKKAFFPECDL